MGSVATKGDTSVDELAVAVRRLEAEVQEAELAADWAAEVERNQVGRNLGPFGEEGAGARIRLIEAVTRRDALRERRETARVEWIAAARPGLIAERDSALKDARIAAKNREAAMGGLFDALDGLLRANATWSGAELAVRDALERAGSACALLGEAFPADSPLISDHPFVFLRYPDLPLSGFLFGTIGTPPSVQVFEAARAALAQARKKAQER